MINLRDDWSSGGSVSEMVSQWKEHDGDSVSNVEKCRRGWLSSEEVSAGTGLEPAFHSHWSRRSLYRWPSSSRLPCSLAHLLRLLACLLNRQPTQSSENLEDCLQFYDSRIVFRDFHLKTIETNSASESEKS